MHRYWRDGTGILSLFHKKFYPPKEFYKEGIHTILFHYERENPNAKIQMASFREEVARELEKKQCLWSPIGK